MYTRRFLVIRKIGISLLFVFNFYCMQAAQAHNIRHRNPNESFRNHGIGQKRFPFPMKSFDQLVENEKKFKEYLAQTIKTIDEMIENGAQMNVKDHHHKSVLDYCDYKDVYNCWRAHGALSGFELLSYANREELDFAGMLILSAVGAIIAVVVIKNIINSLCNAGDYDEFYA